MSNNEKLWYKVARTIVKAGNMPFPITDKLYALLKELITDEEAKFIGSVFRKPSLTMEQIKQKSDLNEDSINKTLDRLMRGGVIVRTQSRSTGVTVYRLMGPFPGMFEFTMMKGETDEHHKKLAILFEDLFNDMSDKTQENYDSITAQYKNFPAIDRTVPVEEEVDVGQEHVLSSEEVTKLIDDYEDIGLAHCYCRHEKDLANDSCKVSGERENCIVLGKGARFMIEYEFAKTISKEDAKKILLYAEDEGLVHKVFHVHLDPSKPIEGICSCCACCCGIFRLFYKGVMPLHTTTNYIAEVNEEDCTGCGTCEEKCPMEAIELEDGIAQIDTSRCIGCGLCVHHCPDEVMKLKHTGLRDVFVLPPKIKQT
jgi:NAD-dependent dihydropyrimidine dehydrogenase PreA subunit/predicted transcriptional regulator